MRGLALLSFLPLLALAGCSGEPADDDATGGGPDGALVAEVPKDIVFSGNLRGVGAGLVAMPEEVPACTLGEDRQCATHTVQVANGTWNVTFTLVGTNGQVTAQGVPGGTDYDLFVDGVGQSTNPAGQKDIVKARLPPGSYSAQVLAWHDVDGSYTLTVSFSP